MTVATSPTFAALRARCPAQYICREPDGRNTTGWYRFAAYDYNQIPQDGRHIEEVVNGELPFVPFIDYDEARQPGDLRTVDQVVASVSLALATRIAPLAYATVPDVLAGIVACEQSDAHKFSCHVSAPAYLVPNYLAARVIAGDVATMLKDQGMPGVDMCVYRRAFNLRLVNAGKSVDGKLVRTKRPTADKPPALYLIQRDEDATRVVVEHLGRLPAMLNIDTTPAPYVPRVVHSPAIIAAVLASFPYLRLHQGGSFKRDRPAHCTSCARVHHNDGAYLRSNAVTGVTSLVCARAAAGAPALTVYPGDVLDGPARVSRFHDYLGRLNNADVDVTRWAEVYDDKYCRSIGDYEGDIAIRATWGAGKTTSVLGPVVERVLSGGGTVLFVSPRVAFTANICGRLNLTSYSSIRGAADLTRTPGVCCQLESLPTLFPESATFDLVVLDEACALAKQAAGTTFALTAKSTSALTGIVAAAKQVIASDNDITRGVCRWIENARGAAIRYVHNTHKAQQGKTANILRSFGNRGRKRVETAITDKLHAWVTDGFVPGVNAAVVCCHSVTTAEAVVLGINEAFPHVRTRLFTGRTEDAEKRRLFGNPDANLADCDVLVYTSSVEVGVSIDDPRFSVAFGLFNDDNLPARSTAQMLFRARAVSNYHIGVSESGSVTGAPLTVSGVWDGLATNRKDVRAIAGDLIAHNPAVVRPEQMRGTVLGDMWAEHAAHMLRSKAAFAFMLGDILGRAGITVTRADVDDLAEVEEPEFVERMTKLSDLKVLVNVAEATAVAESPLLTEEELATMGKLQSKSVAQQRSLTKTLLVDEYEQRDGDGETELAGTAQFYRTFGAPTVVSAHRARRQVNRWMKSRDATRGVIPVYEAGYDAADSGDEGDGAEPVAADQVGPLVAEELAVRWAAAASCGAGPVQADPLAALTLKNTYRRHLTAIQLLRGVGFRALDDAALIPANMIETQVMSAAFGDELEAACKAGNALYGVRCKGPWPNTKARLKALNAIMKRQYGITVKATDKHATEYELVHPWHATTLRP